MLKIERRASVVLYRFLKSNFEDDIFLLPANVCPIVPLTFFKAGVDFFFVDIDKRQVIDSNICLDLLSRKKINGILFVHPYGKIIHNETFYKEIKAIDSSITIIDDKCLCIPDLSKNNKPNIDLELFSTGYSKFVELSFGGWGNISDKYDYEEENLPYNELALARQLEAIKYSLNSNSLFRYVDSDWLNTQPLKNKNRYFELIKSKISEIKQHKNKINKIYETELPGHIKFSTGYHDWRYMLSINNRSNVLAKIKKEGYFAGTNYPSVAYIFKQQKMPDAEFYGKRTVNLFNDFRVKESNAKKISEIIKKFSS